MNSSYSPWSNFSSITHKLIDERTNINIHSESEHYRLNSSLNMLIIIGFASSVEGFFRSFLIDFENQNLKPKKKDNCFSKIFFSQKQTDIRNQNWNDLKGTFKKKTNIRLSTIFKNKDKKLNEKVDAIFLFRNFFAHSNSINLTNNNKIYVKRITDYLKKWNLHNDEHWTLDNVISDEIVNHFKDAHLELMSINYKKHIGIYSLADDFSEKNDYETSENKNQFWYREK